MRFTDCLSSAKVSRCPRVVRNQSVLLSKKIQIFINFHSRWSHGNAYTDKRKDTSSDSEPAGYLHFVSLISFTLSLLLYMLTYIGVEKSKQNSFQLSSNLIITNTYRLHSILSTVQVLEVTAKTFQCQKCR